MSAFLQFGPFLLDRAGARVLRDGTMVPMTSRQFDLLLFFVDHAGALVTRDALLASLWASGTSENAVGQAVSDLRHALGDLPTHPEYIQTVAGIGYRFISTLVSVEGPPTTTEARIAAARAALRSAARHDAGASTPRRIAVLDFAAAPADFDGAWLSAAIGETLSEDLRALAGFHVIERQIVAEAVAALGNSVQVVGRNIGANMLVTGTFQRTRTRIRLAARIVDAESREPLAEVKVEGLADEVFELQDQLVLEFAKQLGLTLRQGADARFGVRDTGSLNAYRAFTAGSTRGTHRDVGELTAAADDFRAALALDDRYTLARVRLAATQFALYETTRADNQPVSELLDDAIEHARLVLDRDEAQPDAHGILSRALAARGQLDDAARHARRAIALEPDNWRHLEAVSLATWGAERLEAVGVALAHKPACTAASADAAAVLVARGDLAAAEERLRQGLAAVAAGQSRTPAPGLHWLLGLLHLHRSDTNGAITCFEQELERADLRRPYGREYAMLAHLGYGLALLTSKHAFDALSEFGAALALYPDHCGCNLATAAALVEVGDRVRAGRHLTAADDAIAVLEAHRPIEAAMMRGQRLSVTGTPDAALDVLTRMLDDAPPGCAGWSLPVEPLLGAVRARPAFAALQQRLASRAT